jgi:Protein of unknown function (DUF732)
MRIRDASVFAELAKAVAGSVPCTRIRNSAPARTLLAAVLVLAVAVPGALGAAPTARADATDDAFIAALKARGISHESDQAAIAAGRLVCHQLDEGKSQEEIATDVMNSSGLDGEHAGYFVAVAERAYCPRYADIPS